MSAGTYTGIGWRWRQLSAGGFAHLVPQTVLARSTTACLRPLQGVVLLDLGLATGERCATCLAKNGGQP